MWLQSVPPRAGELRLRSRRVKYHGVEAVTHYCAALFLFLSANKLSLSSDAVFPISSCSHALVRADVRLTDGPANSRLAGDSVRRQCLDFRADGLGQDTGCISGFARCVVPPRRRT